MFQGGGESQSPTAHKKTQEHTYFPTFGCRPAPEPPSLLHTHTHTHRQTDPEPVPGVKAQTPLARRGRSTREVGQTSRWNGTCLRPDRRGEEPRPLFLFRSRASGSTGGRPGWRVDGEGRRTGTRPVCVVSLGDGDLPRPRTVHRSLYGFPDLSSLVVTGFLRDHQVKQGSVERELRLPGHIGIPEGYRGEDKDTPVPVSDSPCRRDRLRG